MTAGISKNIEWLKLAFLVVSIPLMLGFSLNMFCYDLTLELASKVVPAVLDDKSSEYRQSKGSSNSLHFYISYHFELDGKRYTATDWFSFLKEQRIEVPDYYYKESAIGDSLQIRYFVLRPEINRPILEKVSIYNFIFEFMVIGLSILAIHFSNKTYRELVARK
jgi:hypothetical protein